jgi:hypothetical protein
VSVALSREISQHSSSPSHASAWRIKLLAKAKKPAQDRADAELRESTRDVVSTLSALVMGIDHRSAEGGIK